MRRALLALAVAVLCVRPIQVEAVCISPWAPCAQNISVLWQGSTFCQRWYSDAYFTTGAAGSYTGDSGTINAATLLALCETAHASWRGAGYCLPVANFSSSGDTSYNGVSFVNDAQWIAWGLNPDFAAIARMTWSTATQNMYFKGKIYVHVPSSPALWRYSADVTIGTPASNTVDLPSLLAHEVGHWYGLNNVPIASCPSAVMGSQLSSPAYS